MPVRVFLNGEEKWLTPTDRWATMTIDSDGTELAVDNNFCVGIMIDTGK